MEKLPVASQQLPIDTIDESKPPAMTSTPFGLPFFSFSYTSMQMHVADGRTQVQSKQISFNGSKLNVEQFEGELPTSVFEQTVLDTQRLFIDQAAGMFRQMSSWFPFPLLGHIDDEK